MLKSLAACKRVTMSNMLFDEAFNEETLNTQSAWFNPKIISKNLDGNAMDFYGSFIGLRKQDKVRALENELLRDLAMQLKDEKTKNMMVEDEKGKIDKDF